MTDVHPVQRTNDKNNLQAFYSFLRVLVVAEAAALLPLWLGANDYPTVQVMILNAVPALLLTLVNYFRPGEVRFGVTKPNIERV